MFKKNIGEEILLFINPILIFSFYNPIGNLASRIGRNYSSYIYIYLDKVIPFNTDLLFIYLLEFILPSYIVMMIIIKYNIFILRKIYIALVILDIFCFIFYLVFPVSTNLIVTQMHLSLGTFSKLFLSHMILFNAFPSMHILNGWLFYRIMKDYFKKYSYLYLIWFILMLCSTLFLKLHYTLDVLLGLILAEILYQSVFVMNIDANPYIKSFILGKRIIPYQLSMLVLLLILHGMAYYNNLHGMIYYNNLGLL